MNSLQDKGTTELDTNAGILYEQVRLLFASVPFSVTSIPVVSLLLLTLEWNVIDHRILSGWLSALVLVSVFRFWQYRRFQAAESAPAEVDKWFHHALFGAALSGLMWAAAGLLLFSPESMPHQLFLTFITVGVAAGAVTTLSALYPAVLFFLVASLLPLSWSFFSLDTQLGMIMGGLLIFFMLMLAQTSRRLNTIIVETLRMRVEKVVAEATIHHQALYDELTDLPNRRMLFDQLGQDMARSRRHGYMGAILFLDLDNFKNVNDSLGHALGDKLLKQVASRLASRLREEDTAARLGGDEFVILLSQVGKNSVDAAARTQYVASEIQRLFSEPFKVDGHTLYVTASIGMVLFPLDESGPGDLLQRADVAMYRAKEEGRDRFRFFQPAMQQVLDSRLTIEKGLRKALETNQLELVYQPQVDAQGCVNGAEALVRWRHPERGLISPAEFICVAEETGLIYRLGDWVLCAACEHIRELSATRPMNISVNISPNQFREPAFVSRVQEIVTEYGIDPRLLHLEITESTMLDNIEQTIERMEAIRSLGISFAVDDFGTGHSSLAYLKRLPIEIVKIDRSFVSDIVDDPNDAILVETIIVMAQHLGLKTIAEGVETWETLEFLKEKGCHNFQGYLFSRPISFQELLVMKPCLLPDNGPAAELIHRVG
ncbi:putative bifunctional diguanylate cyclase/phosphodiesterase [Thiolapillus sp.]